MRLLENIKNIFVFHLLCAISEINLEDTFARLEKKSSKLDVFRSLIRIFAPTHQSTQWAGGADILERTFTNVIFYRQTSQL